jgi:hypothetical protein
MGRTPPGWPPLNDLRDPRDKFRKRCVRRSQPRSGCGISASAPIGSAIRWARRKTHRTAARRGSARRCEPVARADRVALSPLAVELLFVPDMQIRHGVPIIVVALLLAPVVASVGALVIIPLALVMLPVLLLAGVVGFAVLLSSRTEPAQAAAAVHDLADGLHAAAR